MAKGSKNKLDDLHGVLTKYLIDMVKSGKELSPGEISNCITFLKNNNVGHSIVEESKQVNLLDAVRDYDDSLDIESYFVPDKIEMKKKKDD